MNRENVLIVADAIEHLPYEKSQDFWADPKAFNMNAGCGSACCIGGWTGEVCSGGYQSLEQARETLGLTQRQADALFIPPGYHYMKCDGRTAAQVLRLMAKAGDRVTGKRILSFWRNSGGGV